MQDFENKKIILGICGGIAAYKSAYLIRELTRLGAEVRVVMTESAKQFITPMTLQALSGNEVRSELFDPQAERAMGHIELARWADLLLIAPASANCLAKMAHGLADDLLSTLYLVAETPVLVCPAMNRSMWKHPATQENCALLSQRGAMIIGPEEGMQACGEEGFGRMSEVENIITALRFYPLRNLLQGQKIMITAGPTREAIDPVRYLTNRSSGKMGYALAQAACMAGAEVLLISGPTALQPPVGVRFSGVESAQEMFAAVTQHFEPGMIFIGAAAVADYRVETPSVKKLKKNEQTSLTCHLSLNPDILAAIAASKKAKFVIGFAAETNDVIIHAKEKLKNKQLDMIIANQVGAGIGFDSDDNQVTVLTSETQKVLPFTHKARIAGQIVAILAASLQNAAL
ncbi:bifunctional phosphopantothenoylcysteine decarboxylase/phosphopantothenate--cysteine ligase CoaBC [Legionella septentrionalis]|uniref:bifunctional phosphopantothenoylcysteine decarboxylase/phosphopantothenate--cysteine ligase CoaBC n=1 Tax=Legionella septentrionalis TaxID=2498109 RepID=UPI000F8D3D10|nr:bifunctional phosphopantothenoylcysteine decarboxylase/phosphopantothenate--cysteine ligase CoaBC [Legionella septentrionalis]RUQ94654.1 bifunctional phosphopantothenoylcysteine decarboxylase/phosphopantothenate--cysteine ligase CoaBC [Legionella septentrionalis]